MSISDKGQASGTHKPFCQSALDAVQPLGIYLAYRSQENCLLDHGKASDSNQARQLESAGAKVGIIHLQYLVKSWDIVTYL